MTNNGSSDGDDIDSRSGSIRSPTLSNLVSGELIASRYYTAKTDDNYGKAEGTTKELLCVRHGVSISNEFMSRPENKWGSPTFRDDPKLFDAPLSQNGEDLTKDSLPHQLLHQEDLRAFLTGISRHYDEPNDGGVELVLVSPLTRCLQTYVYGVEPALLDLLTDHDEDGIRSQNIDRDPAQKKTSITSNDDNLPGTKLPIPVLALPLLRERVYTVSETGRPISALEKEFPSVNFSECHDEDNWWYTGPDPIPTATPVVGNRTDSNSYRDEWRPHGRGQWYAVPGEPQAVFDRRMEQLKEWLFNRNETKILLVTHWGVLHYLSGGTGWKNSEAKILQLRPDL
jgi:broad specificity phosphatase PhoE